jgi:hypothetical protein
MTRQEWLQIIAIGTSVVSPYVLELFKHWFANRPTKKSAKLKPTTKPVDNILKWLTRLANFSNLAGIGLSLFTVFSAIVIQDPVTRSTVIAAALGTFALLINYHDLRRRMQRKG